MANDQDYPLPAHCASIWTNGEAIFLAFSPTANGKGHTIAIPLDRCGIELSEWGEPLASQRGWHVLRETLLARARDATVKPLTVGTKGAPVQYDVDGMLRHLRKYDSRGQETCPDHLLPDIDEL